MFIPLPLIQLQGHYGRTAADLIHAGLIERAQ